MDTPHYDMVISGTIAGLLKVRRSTVDQLAACTPITRATLYRKLREGKWNVNEAGAIAAAFHIDVNDLYRGRITDGPPLEQPFQGGIGRSDVTHELARSRCVTHGLKVAA